MKNDIWDEISSFLNGLRCEKINRKSIYPVSRIQRYSVEEENEKGECN